jgi:small-conductance mechanosensitive channel
MLQLLRQYGPLFYATILSSALRIGGILIFGYITLRIVDSALNRLRLIIPTADSPRAEQRTENLRHIIRSISKIILIVILALTISSELGYNIGPVLASASILGLAIGIGAQSLVKDLISGFFILFEDHFSVGDVVKVGDFTGVVERMTLRVTVVRNLEGQVYLVPNGNIQNVTVMTKDWARAVLDITVSQKQELPKVFDTLKAINTQLAQDWPDRVLEQPTVLGIDKLDDSGVTIRSAVKTPPFKNADVLREWRRRVKEEFSRAGIELTDRGSQEVRVLGQGGSAQRPL